MDSLADLSTEFRELPSIELVELALESLNTRFDPGTCRYLRDLWIREHRYHGAYIIRTLRLEHGREILAGCEIGMGEVS